MGPDGPVLGQSVLHNVSKSPVFRSKFGGLFIPIVAALERLGSRDFNTPAFIKEKLAKICEALKEEERLLGIMRAEVTAREARVKVLRSALESAENRDWKLVIGFETLLPRLPTTVKRARRKPQVDEPRRNPEQSRKQKRSFSRPLVSGG